jgi:cell division protein FtsQ
LGRRLLGVALAPMRGCTAFVWRRRRSRLTLLVLLAALAPLGGGWLWLRNSSLVAVEHVQISGVHGVNAGSIERALERTARQMSTLDVKLGALRAAVAPFHVVREVLASTSFPHGLRIRVIEQLPVAVLMAGDPTGSGTTVAGGERTAVAADGAVLGPTLAAGSLPVIHTSASEPLLGGHVRGAALGAELSVLGAAPSALLGWVQRVFMGPEGVTVVMRDGLSIYFGNATRPHAKWLSTARVLADPSSAGATYVDVRLPERPAAGTTAAGGLGDSASRGDVSASDPTAAALASTLDEAVSGGASGTSAATSTPSTPPASSPEAASGSAAAATGTAAGAGTTAGSGAEAAAAGSGESTSQEPSTSASG